MNKNIAEFDTRNSKSYRRYCKKTVRRSASNRFLPIRLWVHISHWNNGVEKILSDMEEKMTGLIYASRNAISTSALTINAQCRLVKDSAWDDKRLILKLSPRANACFSGLV